MSVSSKQDRQGARTPTDLEYKYQFGKTFAEIMGIATDARNTAEQAAELDEQLTQEEIFKRLTNDGEVQAVFRGDDGQLYINAAYIVALAEMFAKNITMTGTLSNTVEAFLEPSVEENQAIINHIDGTEYIIPSRIPLYDFNGDGVVDYLDKRIAYKAMMGEESLENWTGAVKTPVTLTMDLTDPEKAIRITGTNMWGREVDEYIGVNGVTMRHTGSADFVVEEGTMSVAIGLGWHYRKWNSGKAECWLKKDVEGCSCNTAWGSMYTTDKSSGVIPYPFEFTTPPVEMVTAKANGWSFIVFNQANASSGGMNTTTTSGEYKATRPTAPSGTVTVEYSFYVVGNWR